MDEHLLKSLEDLQKRCASIGVTPLELYMRQNGLCWLELSEGEVFCTDGKDRALTDQLANPTYECSKCFVSFIKRLLDEKSEPQDKE
jgi:hypothetical protein